MAYEYSPKYPAFTYFSTAKAQKGVTFKAMATEVGGGSGEIVTSVKELLGDSLEAACEIGEISTQVKPMLDIWVPASNPTEKVKWVVIAGAAECATNSFVIFSIMDLMLTKAYSKDQFLDALVHLIYVSERCDKFADSMLKVLDSTRSNEEKLIVGKVEQIPELLSVINSFVEEINAKI